MPKAKTKKTLPKSLTTVTRFSKILAVILLFIFLLVGIYFGMQYQRSIDLQTQASNSAY